MTRKRMSASRVEQQMACHGSADLERAIPGFQFPVVDQDAGAKGRGNLMHEIMEKASGLSPAELRGLIKAQLWLLDMLQRRNWKRKAEYEVHADWLPSRPLIKADLVLHLQDEIHIIDWKTGKIPVGAVRNKQLMHYAATLIGLSPKAKSVHLHIVQPWADNIDSWEVSTDELAVFMQDANAADVAIEAGSTTLAVGDHCKFCPANPQSRGDKGKPFCPAMMKFAYPLQENTDDILNF